MSEMDFIGWQKMKRRTMTIKPDLAKTEPRQCGTPHIGGCPLLSIGTCLVLGTLDAFKN